MHPYQHVYFNALVPQSKDYIRKTFEQDYWGTSFREAYEFIAYSDDAPEIRVNASPEQHPALYNHWILSDAERQRIRVSLDPEKLPKSDYFISNYRYHPEDYPFGEEVYTIWRGNSKILSVIKVRQGP